jgi:hypothetical protein
MDTKKKNSLKSNKKPKKLSKSKGDGAKTAEQIRREMIKLTKAKTDLSEAEIAEAEEKFKEDYPSGRITLDEFVDQSDVSLRATSRSSTHAGNNPGLCSIGRDPQVGFLSDALFRSYDSEARGDIDFFRCGTTYSVKTTIHSDNLAVK